MQNVQTIYDRPQRKCCEELRDVGDRIDILHTHFQILLIALYKIDGRQCKATRIFRSFERLIRLPLEVCQ
jgi:hypothetical protein